MLGCLLFVVGCGGSPAAPTLAQQPTPAPQITPAPAPLTRPTWGISGQSNADLLTPHLAPYADEIGYSLSSMTIDQWAPTGSMWSPLAASLTKHVDAFIWWQGESDIGGMLGDWDNPLNIWLPKPGAYAAALADVVRRVRGVLGQPELRVVVIRLASDRLDAEQDAFIGSDGHALAIQTRDIGFADGTHMTEAGYDSVAQRIAMTLSAR